MCSALFSILRIWRTASAAESRVLQRRVCSFSRRLSMSYISVWTSGRLLSELCFGRFRSCVRYLLCWCILLTATGWAYPIFSWWRFSRRASASQRRSKRITRSILLSFLQSPRLSWYFILSCSPCARKRPKNKQNITSYFQAVPFRNSLFYLRKPWYISTFGFLRFWRLFKLYKCNTNLTFFNQT